MNYFKLKKNTLGVVMAVYDTIVKSDFSMHLQTDMKVPLCI